MNENNEQTNETKIRLLPRIITRFHGIKIGKKLRDLTIKLLVILTMLSGCDTTTIPETPDSSYTENETQHNKENPYSGYSQLLQNVLLNKEYTSILNTADYRSALFDSHPYAFLEKEGFDVDGIKSGEIECRTRSYVMDDEPNNLYIQTTVTEGTSHKTNYLLRYTLTEQEMADYRLLHEGDSEAYYYVQATFMNNEISKMKTPTIIGKSKVALYAFEKLETSLEKYPLEGVNFAYTTIFNPNQKNKTVDILIAPDTYDQRRAAFDTQVKMLHCTSRVPLTINGGIYESPYIIFSLPDDSYTLSEVTFFDSQTAMLNYAYCKQFTKNDK